MVGIVIANKDTLIKKGYLGQYGSIQKIIINKNGYFKNESDILPILHILHKSRHHLPY